MLSGAAVPPLPLKKVQCSLVRACLLGGDCKAASLLVLPGGRAVSAEAPEAFAVACRRLLSV